MATPSDGEKWKRRRERTLAVALGLLFLLLSWIEIRLLGLSETLPFHASVFFIGLVNFNVIIFLLLIFLIFRNVVKDFVDGSGGVIGSSLKSKLIAAFVGFSFVPTALMFVVSVFYINNSFDRWFSEKMTGILKSSLELTNAYYYNAKKKNYHFARAISQALEKAPVTGVPKTLEKLRDLYSLDAVEYYPGLFDDRIVVRAAGENIPEPPEISLEFRRKGVEQGLDDSMVHLRGEGNLIRVIVPASIPSNPTGAVVVSTYVPLSLISRIDDITAAYENFRDTDPLAYPIKSIYLIILFLMTLVILLAATWFGVYLARQLSVPLEALGLATKKVARGEFQSIDLASGTREIHQLIDNFNRMTAFIETSERELRQANSNLRQTLDQLDEHSRYISVVLSNVSTGVVSLDNSDIVTMVNPHAADLLGLDAISVIGRPAAQVLPSDFFHLYQDLLTQTRKHSGERLQREATLSLRERVCPIQLALSLLRDEAGSEVGKVLVFDDLTVVLNAQRAAAWSEVAKRIAHEIKNPLTPIKLAAQRLQRRFGRSMPDPAFAESTNMIIRQVDDMKTLVNEFSQFARMPQVNPVVTSLNEVVHEAIALFRAGHRDIRFVYEPSPALPEFAFDPDQIKRVVANLLDNSVAALQGRADGMIKLETKFDPLLRIASLIVTDNGPGIPEELLGRVFEPYVTTKKNGTGLGLAIVKRTVEDHGGYIRAQNLTQGGIRIVIELPVVEATRKPVDSSESFVGGAGDSDLDC